MTVLNAETAVNIGYSCKLLTEEMEQIFVVDGDTMETVREQLTSAKSEMLKSNSAGGTTNPGYTDSVTNPNSRYGTMSNGNPLSQDIEVGSFALIINGHSLVSNRFSNFIYYRISFKKRLETHHFLLAFKHLDI